MKEELSEQQTQAILKALDDAIDNGPWDESNFLRVIGKNLQVLREEFASQVNASPEKLKFASHLANRIALRTGQQEIFVSLYTSEGMKLNSWERLLTNLPKQIISRAIYANEDDVMTWIRSKDNPTNEAYVSIYINQSDLLSLSAEKTPKDKLGKPLLTLKDKAISLDNINRFVHKTGTFQFVHGRLIPDKNNSSK